PIVSNHLPLDRLIEPLRRCAQRDRHRVLVVLESPAEGWCRAFAADRQLPFIAASDRSDRADRITGLLGQEFETLVHETSERLDGGLLAALAGTVKAGGVMVLGVPFRVSESAADGMSSMFNRRFCRLLLELQLLFPDKVHLLASAASPARANSHAVLRSPESAMAPALHCAESEQTALLELARDYLLKHPRGSITITGRRGRGKSALLGRIAEWLIDRQIPVTVTASRRTSVTSVNRHSRHIIRFRAADEACRSGTGVLLVDEAGSLPIDTLIGFSTHHDQVIYCTTVEGYENAGRAFEIRFQQALKRTQVQCLALTPVLPWRWAPEDPLESLVDTLLLARVGQDIGLPDDCLPKAAEATNAEPARTAAAETMTVEAVDAAVANCRARQLTRTELADDEALLRAVFGLLRDTHYQTSATDLQHLLDAPDLQVWVLEHDRRIKAALLAIGEGSLPVPVHEAIVSKQRRLPNQLLPQLLAQCANDPQVLDRRYARIIRIAVASDCRRQGLGTRLLQHVEIELAMRPGVSAIGASFASDAGSLAFWQSNGYRRFHTGYRRNPRTGRQAVAVIKPFDATVARVAERAVDIHDDNQRCRQGQQSLPDTPLHDGSLLQRFARGERSVHDTYAALSRLGLRHALPLQYDGTLSRRRYESMLRKLVTDVIGQSVSTPDPQVDIRS
ncbi:MAG: tRNA(Met) cytidine acetyltransferase, partial [Granulosicoccus sp.]|nr:tRNA(Met) cytidine acetyltransferase [Granulosicoccus sp.]